MEVEGSEVRLLLKVSTFINKVVFLLNHVPDILKIFPYSVVSEL